MLLKTNSNAMSVRKNLVWQVITKNTFFFMKKKKRSLYVMNVGKGLLILHSLTVMNKCIHLKKYINVQIGVIQYCVCVVNNVEMHVIIAFAIVR